MHFLICSIFFVMLTFNYMPLITILLLTKVYVIYLGKVILHEQETNKEICQKCKVNRVDKK